MQRQTKLLIRVFVIFTLSQVTDLIKTPHFAEVVPNVTVTQGREAVLPCVVNDLGKYKVAWFHVEKKQVLTIHTNLITRNYRVTLDNRDHRHWILHIKDIKESDRGHYMCQINTSPMKKQVGYLQVVVPPRIDEYRTVSDAVALEGADITLSCSASGYPEPTIKWRREDGGYIPTVDKNGVERRVDEVEGRNLEIKRVSRLDMGAFLCMASNGVAPSVSHRVLLQVNFPPMLWIPNQLIGAELGKPTTLECNGEAYPKSISYWTNKTGDIIISDEHYSTTMTDVNSFKTHMMFKILKVRKQDYGVYKCISKNPLGVTEGQLTLYETIGDVYKGRDTKDHPTHNMDDSRNIIILDKDSSVKEQLIDQNGNTVNTKELKNHSEGKLLPTRTDLSKRTLLNSSKIQNDILKRQFYYSKLVKLLGKD